MVTKELYPTRPGAFASCLAGGGEMGALMRAHDWSNTPLGAVERWPQSLCTTVSLLLNSRYPMFLFWGPELVCLYNDGYRPSLGAHKHPQALGQRGAECWAEIWDIIGPQIDGVMSRGERTWHEDQLVPFDRNGYLEEIYFTYSYSPVRDERGVGGTLVVCSETTARVLAERRLRTLSDLAARSARAKQVQQALRLIGETLGENPFDIPFALLYQLEDGRSAQLAAVAGIAAATPASPQRVGLDAAAQEAWPLAAVAASGRAESLGELGRRFGPLPGGAWPEPPHTAAILPITLPGHERPSALLVAAFSARKAPDQHYREFFDLLAGQVASALAGATAYEEERRRAQALAELDRAKTAFFNNISHEFRTPLSLMLGPAEDALDDAEQPLAPIQRERIGRVLRNGRRLLKLVNTLLEFSRIEAGRIEARYRATDLGRLTAELVSLFRAAVERAGLRLDVDCPTLPAPFYVDHEMWEKIVLNLLSNALKFTREGTISVTLRWSEERAGAELTVRDTGVGIPNRELPKLFVRFHRVRGARGRSHEGSGIGLALVQELVRLHGGEIAVVSREGRGSAFTVSLPAGSAHLPPEQIDAAADDADAALAIAQPFLQEAFGWLPGDAAGVAEPVEAALPTGAAARAASADAARILIADDNADLRAYLSRLLSRYWLVETAHDGDDALRAVRERRPDLLLADVMMPGLDGFALLRALRADPGLSAVPVILLSARAGEEARLEGLQAGADDYLVKPFSARELLARVGSQLALRRVRDEAYAALQKSEHHMRAVLNSLFAFVGVLTPDGTLCEANRPPLEAAGLRIEDVRGKKFWDCYWWNYDAEVQARLQASCERAARGQASRYDVAVRMAGGALLSIDFMLAPLCDDDGRVTHLIPSGIDISRRLEVERALREARAAAETARAEAEAANRSKSEFLANMSHEIRTPMSAVLGYTDILAAHLDDPDDLASVEVIRRNGRHLLALINDILDLSKIEAGRLSVERERVAPDVLLAEVYSLMAMRARDKGLTFGVEFDGELPETIDSDPRRLRQILINLVGNAIKFTERGGVTLKTWLDEAAGAAPRLVIEVRDTGPGIGKKQQRLLFRPFIQLDASSTRSHEGSGLGLAISRRLAEVLGGSIGLESRRHRGSTFTLTVPTGPLDGVARRRPSLERAAPAAGAGSQKLRRGVRLLVVDDRRDIRHLVQQILEEAGAEVVLAESGYRALEAAARARGEDRPFAAVVMDMHMPGMDGFRATRRLRAEGFDGPVIALTARAMKGEREKCLAAGCSDYLPKPVDGAVLTATLARAIEHARDERPGAEPRPAPQGCRVLVVDDSRDAATALARMLHLHGFEVATAFDGRSALAQAQQQRPQAVVLDLNLPDVSGLDVARRLKQDPLLDPPLCVVLSGEAVDARTCPEIDYRLLKPADIGKLLALLPDPRGRD